MRGCRGGGCPCNGRGAHLESRLLCLLDAERDDIPRIKEELSHLSLSHAESVCTIHVRDEVAQGNLTALLREFTFVDLRNAHIVPATRRPKAEAEPSALRSM